MFTNDTFYHFAFQHTRRLLDFPRETNWKSCIYANSYNRLDEDRKSVCVAGSRTRRVCRKMSNTLRAVCRLRRGNNERSAAAICGFANVDDVWRRLAEKRRAEKERLRLSLGEFQPPTCVRRKQHGNLTSHTLLPPHQMWHIEYMVNPNTNWTITKSDT